MEKELILLVGPIGVGKTTFSKSLQNESSIRISQDEMGRKAYLEYFHNALDCGASRVIVDRMNFNRDQRKRFIEPARKKGYNVTIFEFEWDWDVCFKRVTNRQNHPTVPPGDAELTNKILNMYQGMYQKPGEDEYDNYNFVELENESKN